MAMESREDQCNGVELFVNYSITFIITSMGHRYFSLIHIQ